MKKPKIEQYQGANSAWFIKLNGKLICGSHSKEWSDKFLKIVKVESEK